VVVARRALGKFYVVLYFMSLLLLAKLLSEKLTHNPSATAHHARMQAGVRRQL